MRKKLEVPSELELDPKFRAWCFRQDQAARDAGRPYEEYVDLKHRYLSEVLGVGANQRRRKPRSPLGLGWLGVVEHDGSIRVVRTCAGAM